MDSFLIKADVKNLSMFPDASVDGVISTMSLHHLPSINDLHSCFSEARRILSPGGAIFLTDFCRLRNLRSVHFFSHMNEGEVSTLVTIDYENSLKAAFSKEEYRQAITRLIREPNLNEAILTPSLGRDLFFSTTFLVPLLGVIHTKKRTITSQMRDYFVQARAELPANIKKDLDQLRWFFRLGGLPGDPFSPKN